MQRVRRGECCALGQEEQSMQLKKGRLSFCARRSSPPSPLREGHAPARMETLLAKVELSPLRIRSYPRILSQTLRVAHQAANPKVPAALPPGLPDKIGIARPAHRLPRDDRMQD